MFKKIVLSSLLLVILHTTLFAQTKNATISGSVKTTDGHPAESINVALKGTRYGAATDEKGNFKFEAPAGEYIMCVFSISAHRTETRVIIKVDTVNYGSA